MPSKNTAHKYIERKEDAPVKIDRFSKLDVYKPLQEYVHPYRPAKALPAVRRYETPADKQAQMDWGICQGAVPFR